MSRRSTLGLACAVLGTAVLLAGLAVYSLGGGASIANEVVAEENVRLRQELGSMEGRVTSLGDALESLLDREEELRLMADLPSVPIAVQAVGVGGPGHGAPADLIVSRDEEINRRVESMTRSVDVLLRRSELVAGSMEDVNKSLVAKEIELSRTPSIWPSSGFLSSTFSMARTHPIFHDVRPHYGIDISARRGSPIVATADGTVVKAGWQGGYGNQVEIDHGNGLRTTYSHASRLLVQSGQKVERGEAVGLVGSTGYAVAPHVHYEVHDSGKPINPLKYIFPDAIAD